MANIIKPNEETIEWDFWFGKQL